VIFAHPLAITAAARARFNIGPLPRPAGGGSPFAVSWDDRVWDASRAMNAPGQSEWPDSPNYSDLASLWSGGGSFLLAFTESAVTANAVSTLTLVPDRRR
jgi:acyl-homoserine lactone acylase PvdQ